MSSTIHSLLSQWPLVLSIIGGVISLVGIITPETHSQSKKWIKLLTRKNIFTTLGGLLVIAAAAGTSYYQSAEQAELTKKNDEILSLTKTVAEKNYEIAQQNAKIAEHVQESLSWTTGGESFCYFQFPRPNPRTNTIDLVLMTYGKYPVYDVLVKIVDNEARSAAFDREWQKGTLPVESLVDSMRLFTLGTKEIRVGNMYPKIVLPIGKLNLPDADQQSFHIDIWSRNGRAVQQLIYRRVNGLWKGAMRTLQKDGSTKEEIEPGFPRNKKGQMEWPP